MHMQRCNLKNFLFRRTNLNPSALGNELVASFSLQNRLPQKVLACMPAAQDLKLSASEVILPISVTVCSFNRQTVWFEKKCPSLQSSSSPPQTSDVDRAGR